jgi:hypothetical protein
MPEEKYYRCGNWTRNTKIRFTDVPVDNVGMGPWWKPWQRLKTEVVMVNFCTINIGVFGGIPEVEYGTDEEVARDRLRERFGPK